MEQEIIVTRKRSRRLWYWLAMGGVVAMALAVRILFFGPTPLEKALAASEDGFTYAIASDSRGQIYVGTQIGLFGGESPRTMRPDQAVGRTIVHAIVPQGGVLYLGGHDIGVSLLRDGKLVSLLPGDVHALAAGHGKLVAGLADGSLLLSLDQGKSWQPLSRPGIEVLALSFHPQQPDLLVAAGAGNGGNVALSQDGGKTWRQFGGIEPVKALAHDPTRAGRLFAAADGALWTSSDGGQTWARRHGEPGREITGVTVSGAETPGVMIVTNDGMISKVEKQW